MEWFNSLSKPHKVFSVGFGLLLLLNLLAAWPKPSAKSVEAAAKKQEFLVIKEWDIKLPIGNELSGLRYVIHGNEVRFYTDQLASYGCREDSSGLPRGLLRSDTRQIEATSLAEPSFRQLTAHWFSLTGAQAMCFDRPPDQIPPAVMQSYEQMSNVLEPALRQLQPV